MIGKTRQTVGPARGVLKGTGGGPGTHRRVAPAAGLVTWVAHYWEVSWDLAEPLTVATVPHPNVHLVFESNDRATVNGVHTGRFTTVLEGKARAFGVKFRPGGFRPFYGAAVAELANRSIDARKVFGELCEASCEAMDQYFLGRLPSADKAVAQADEMVALILADATIGTVDELAARSGVGKRSLQRLFREYVGASPKWVIRRYRLHEAVERIHAGDGVDMAALAVELGYYDQAHLIDDFRTIVGVTPGQYAARL